MTRLMAALIFVGVAGSSAFATETITYNYDALGRLVVVVHTGTVNNGIQTNYTFDPADNRTNTTVSGAPS